MLPQLALGLIRGAEGRAVDIAVAESMGQRNLPRPAVLHGRRDGLGRHRVTDRGWQCHCGIVEQVLSETHERGFQGLRDQQSRKARAVDEKIRCQALALPRADRCDRTLLIEVCTRHVGHYVMHAALDRLAAQELPEQHGIEVIAVPDVEREVFGRLRRQRAGRQASSDEEAVRVRVHRRAVHARIDVVHELSHRQVVEHRCERVEIAVESGLGRPTRECDAALIGGMTFRHPLRLFDTEAVEEPAQPGSRAFADANRRHGGRLHERHFHSKRNEGARQRQRRHPAGRSAAHDEHTSDLGRQRRCTRRRRGHRAVIQSRRYGHSSRRSELAQLAGSPSIRSCTESVALRATARIPS